MLNLAVQSGKNSDRVGTPLAFWDYEDSGVIASV
jgi:hypothetical protein